MEKYEFTNIFDFTRPEYKIKNEIKLIELFSGYGSQALALKYLGIDFVHHRTCEWAIKSIQAYNDLHIRDYTDYSQLLNEEQIKSFLFKKGISANYNEPMTKAQIDRLSEHQVRTIYNNIVATHNLVNIQQVHAKDLGITDTQNNCYIMTYSFPCQDLSLAGNGKGMEKGSGTRSGMLWEVERILKECIYLPQILLMENVPQVHSQDNVKDFNEWQLFLESLGYCNYWEDLNAKDYGIPQNRNRTFMISVLGNYNYKFPQPGQLKLKLKDMLEQDVDEKYYLSDKQIDDILHWNAYEKPFDNMEIMEKTGVAKTLTTRSGAYAAGMLLVKNATEKGYLEATDGDGVDISGRMQYHRGTVQKDMAQTITTSQNNGVVVKDTPNYIEWKEKGKLDIDCRAWKENAIAPTTTTPKNKVLLNNLRIRKLTPKECWRLMGVRDEDYENVAKNQSNASLYHLAGDSIVVNVLIAIFKQLL